MFGPRWELRHAQGFPGYRDDGGDGGGDGGGDSGGGTSTGDTGSSVGGASLSGLGGLGGFAGPGSPGLGGGGYGGGNFGSDTVSNVGSDLSNADATMGLEGMGFDPGLSATPSSGGFFNSFLNNLSSPMGLIGTLGSLALGGLPGLGVSLLSTGLNTAEPGLGSLTKGLYSLSQGNPIGLATGLFGAARQGLFGAPGTTPGASAGQRGGNADPGIRSLSPSFMSTPSGTTSIQRIAPTQIASSSGLFGGSNQQDAMSLFELSQLLTPRG